MARRKQTSKSDDDGENAKDRDAASKANTSPARAGAKGMMTPAEIQSEIDSAEYARMDIGDLRLWEENPRQKMDEGSDRLQKTIGAVGWGADVLVQKGTNRVIGGHLRIMAARKLGLERIPCKVLDVTDERATEIGLADNRAAAFAAWEPTGLGVLLQELERHGSNLGALGFDDKFLDQLASGPVLPPETETFATVDKILVEVQLPATAKGELRRIKQLLDGMSASGVTYGIA